MIFFMEYPSAADFEAAVRYVFDAWAALPAPAGVPLDPADLELHAAFMKWRG